LTNVAIFCWPDADEEDEDGLASPAVRYHPDNLDEITAATKFSKDEIRWVYRAFKQECPSGAINELTFKTIYAKFFPLGGRSVHPLRNYWYYCYCCEGGRLCLYGTVAATGPLFSPQMIESEYGVAVK
jgi:hypothetical protein